MDEQKRKKLVRIGICALGGLTAVMLIVILIVSQLPPATP